MIVVALELDLRITNYPRNLKEKRMVVRSLKDRIQRGFSISIAEISSHDLLQRCGLGIACVSAKEREAQSVIQKIIHFVENAKDFEIVSCNVEVL